MSPPILQGHHDGTMEELYVMGQLKNYEKHVMGENGSKDTFLHVELTPLSAWRRDQLVFSSNSQEGILSSKDTFCRELLSHR